MTAEQTATATTVPPVGIPLRHDRDAVTFWAGESVSLIGSQVTAATLPLLARQTLGGDGTQVGLLQFFLFLPYLALPLLVGVWVDQHRKRPLMMGSNVVRLTLVLTVPTLWWLGVLGFPALYLVAFVLGVATVVYEVAALAFFPRFIGRDRLAEGNTWMMASNSAAGLVGPGLGGVLVQITRSPPITLLLDAFSYIVSICSLAALRRDEPPLPAVERRNLAVEIRAGLSFIGGNRIMRGVSLHGFVFNAGSNMVLVAFLIKATADASAGAGIYGGALAAAGAGALVGASRSRRWTARVGYGTGLAQSAIIASVPLFAIAIVGVDQIGTVWAVIVWATCFLITGFGEGMFNVMSYTVRQSLTPDHMLGRMSAALRLLLYAGIPLGSLLGGLCVDWFGASWAIAVGAAIMVASIPPLFPTLGMRTLPDQPVPFEDNVQNKAPGRRGRLQVVTEARRKGRDNMESADLQDSSTTPSRAQSVTARYEMSDLAKLEAEAVHIIREVVATIENPAMLFSGGKDSVVMLHLAAKAFWPAPVPFPLMHIDTGENFDEVIAFRDRTVERHGIRLIVSKVQDDIDAGRSVEETGPNASRNRLQTVSLLRGIADNGFGAVFGGARRDEEKARAKERVFSFRDEFGAWDPRNQRPELWNLYNGRHKMGENIRVFPLSNWTELDIWSYIRDEGIELPNLYYAHRREVVERNGMLLAVNQFISPRDSEQSFAATVRFRTIGDATCTGCVKSDAGTAADVATEVAAARITERGATRADDRISEAGMEDRKKEGYF